MKNKKRIIQINEDLDQPIGIKSEYLKKYVKKGKIKVIIINEDNSCTEYFVKLGEAYFLTIKDRKYILVSDCIIYGDNPTLMYYYNNPLPIHFKHRISKLKAIDLIEEGKRGLLTPEKLNILSEIVHDSETLQVAFNSTVLKNLYSENTNFFSTRSFLYIAGAIVVIILVILQVTGRVDVLGQLTKMFVQQ